MGVTHLFIIEVSVRAWRYGIVIAGDRFVRRAVTRRGGTPAFRLIMGAANPEANQFENDVQGLLAEMESAGSGRVIFSLLQQAGHQVDIFPLSDSGDERDVRTGPYEPRRSVAPGETLLNDRDQPIRLAGDDRTTSVRERSGQSMTGLGGGSNVFILFSLTRFTSVAPHAVYGYLEPLVMLFHELVHAVFLVHGRQAQGSFRRRGFSQPAADYLHEIWDSPREFFAVTVENILASEFGIRGLRGAHSGFSGGTLLQDISHLLLPEPASVPAGPRISRPELERGVSVCSTRRRPDFLTATDSQMWAWFYEQELQDMHRAFPILWNRLSQVIAPFNPIRDIALGCVP